MRIFCIFKKSHPHFDEFFFDAPAERIRNIGFKTIAINRPDKIKKVDFVKFDVEGAEDLILRSEEFKKAAPKIQAIEVEFHHPTWQELVKYMMELGYEARRYESSAIIVLFIRP